MLLHFIGILFCIFSTMVHCDLQRVIVKGKLMCGDKPAANIALKLVDIDIGSDDVLDKKTTDKEGNFIVDGKTSEMSNIDPILKIYHECADYLPCQRRWKIEIPEQYINHEGSKNLKIMDLGTWNLEAHLKEDINCF
ncbi:Transthyretin-like protein 46 [Trichinella zimbabwensis]|uniref:Transthyretin-like protein 46 n=1 Tax=Trichinella zimbabwensis TaxID=268475 RepID=A0A0V1GXA4_9BILA|nr:Transthyretin-like protein 46 [Trichinella zimbabwensis]